MGLDGRRAFTRQQREDVVLFERHEAQQRKDAPLRVVQPGEQRRHRAQALHVVRELPLKEAHGVLAANTQHAQVLQAHDEEL